MNSTETPGGSGIPAGWYDDPSGQGLRWWDGEQWTEHVHSGESAAAAGGTEGAAGEREGAPPRDLVKLRENIRGRGAKGVGVVLGAAVLVIVVVALLLSGGSDNGGGEPGLSPRIGGPGSGGPSKQAARKAARIEKQLRRQLKSGNVSKGAKKALQAEQKALEKAGDGNAAKQIEAAKKAAQKALENAE